MRQGLCTRTGRGIDCDDVCLTAEDQHTQSGEMRRSCIYPSHNSRASRVTALGSLGQDPANTAETCDHPLRTPKGQYLPTTEAMGRSPAGTPHRRKVLAPQTCNRAASSKTGGCISCMRCSALTSASGFRPSARSRCAGRAAIGRTRHLGVPTHPMTGGTTATNYGKPMANPNVVLAHFSCLQWFSRIYSQRLVSFCDGATKGSRALAR
jgi:hypothetical protein